MAFPSHSFFSADTRAGEFRIRWNVSWLCLQVEEFCEHREKQIQTRDESGMWINEDDNYSSKAFYDVENGTRWFHLMIKHLGGKLEDIMSSFLRGEETEPMYEVIDETLHEFCDMPEYKEHIRIKDKYDISDDEGEATDELIG